MNKRADENRKSKGQRRRMKNRAESDGSRESPGNGRTIVLGLAVTMLLVLASYFFKRSSTEASKSTPIPQVHSERRTKPVYAVFRAPAYARDHSLNNETVLVWGGNHQFTEGLHKNANLSNITRADYAGADACRSCHAENHALWSEHAHRWMNVAADEHSVKGDFSGGETARIEYWGGVGEFYRKNGEYMMKLSRDGIVREFKINRTLGSRVHQYYVGKMIAGPEADGHDFRTSDHVLPFGFELTLNEWIPIVHATGQTGPDSARDDPFENPSRLPYDKSCSICHTTPPAGNLMLAMFKRFAAYTPRKLHFEGSNYIDKQHSGAVRLDLKPDEKLTADNLKHHINDLASQSQQLITEENAVNLGIACEACHLGAKAHTENEKILPPFFPSGPHVLASGRSYQEIWGKTAANKNFICARCHSGERPQFAAGMAVWNSTEYTDAMRGHCYHPDDAAQHGMESLTCVACHNPHETIGRRWKKTSQQDNESCLKCHGKFRDAAVAKSHTHHPIESSGSDCMNCHMPKINEGLGDMVRTHSIFSPTNAAMIEANQPNACNMCHVEESIEWTLEYLDRWYGMTSKEKSGKATGYSSAAIDANYPDRTASAALGWLSSPHSPTRMVGADVLLKAKADWALPQILGRLDDPYMEIRQFTVLRLREYFNINTDDHGYKLYMTEKERKAPVQKMLEELAH